MTTLPARRRGAGVLTVRGPARRLAVGVAAGAAAGLLFGGIGGRLLMFVLRLQSPIASGLESDAGFTIDRVTVGGTLSLAAITTIGGAFAGGAYALLRPAVPTLLRLPLMVLLGATVVGRASIEPDGIDLLVLDPLWLAVGGFIALPALAAAAIVVIVEAVERRGDRPVPEARDRRRLALGAVTTLAATALVIVNGLALIDEVNRVL